MISNVFLYKNRRFIRMFANTGQNLLFSHLVIRILLHFHAVVFLLSALTGFLKNSEAFRRNTKIVTITNERLEL